MYKSLVFLVTLLFVSVTWADEDALYAKVAPPGSSFVRVFFNGSESSGLNVAVGEKQLKDIAPFTASDYIYLEKHDVAVSAGKQKTTVKLKPGNFYTLVYSTSGFKLIEDPVFDNKRKSMVNFYNLVPSSELNLAANEGKIKVLEGVEFGARKEREIKSVRINLAVYQADKKLADADSQNLTRGDVFSLFVYGSKEQPKTVWVKQAVNTSI